MSEALHRPSLGAAVYYRDPFAALDWLEKAFSFECQMVITDSDGRLGHLEMRFGDRVYAARDPEGHVWSFGQTVRKVTREETERASGLKIDGWV